MRVGGLEVSTFSVLKRLRNYICVYIEGLAFDDSWIPAILAANPLHKMKEFTIKMEPDHFVEEGFLTKTSLNELIEHAINHMPFLQKISGEWTKIPDRYELFFWCIVHSLLNLYSTALHEPMRH